MKKLLIILCLFLFACGSEDAVLNPVQPVTPVQITYLTIVNNSSLPLYFVKWENGEYEFNYFGVDQVLSGSGTYFDGIAVSHSYKRIVKPGNSPLYFWFNLAGTDYRRKTIEYISVTAGEDKVFTFTDTTPFMAY